MAVTAEDVREELPKPNEAVSSFPIERAIASHAQLVALEIGEAAASSAAGEEAIRLYAASDARRLLDELSGRSDSPAADALLSRADRTKEALDKATAATDESGGVYSGLVSNVNANPLWQASDFDLNAT